jgi:hypothetical protein
MRSGTLPPDPSAIVVMEGEMQLRKLLMTACMTVGAFALILPAFGETPDNTGQGRAIVTVLPARNGNPATGILQENLQVKLNGKEPGIVGWTPLRGTDGSLELVVLIDSSANTGIALQFDDIIGFIRGLPADAKVAVGTMDAGRAVLEGPLSSDHTRAIGELRVPNGVAGSNSSPYLCLSNLARNWPSADRRARREVILITDGVDNFYPGLDLENPYLQASIRDSIRAGLVIYSIYMPNRGRTGQSLVGQSLLAKVTAITGGYTYWDGTDRNPVSFRPYFDDIALRLQNQYLLRVQSALKGKSEIQNMSLKVIGRESEIFAPQRVNISYPETE